MRGFLKDLKRDRKGFVFGFRFGEWSLSSGHKILVQFMGLLVSGAMVFPSLFLPFLALGEEGTPEKATLETGEAGHDREGDHGEGERLGEEGEEGEETADMDMDDDPLFGEPRHEFWEQVIIANIDGALIFGFVLPKRVPTVGTLGRLEESFEELKKWEDPEFRRARIEEIKKEASSYRVKKGVDPTSPRSEADLRPSVRREIQRLQEWSPKTAEELQHQIRIAEQELEMNKRKLAQFLEKNKKWGFRSLQFLRTAAGIALATTEIGGRAYIWFCLKADPGFSPGYTLLRHKVLSRWIPEPLQP